MTEQATPTETAPAAPAADEVTPTPNPTPAAPVADEVPDWAKDPAKAHAMVEQARREAASARTASRDAAKVEARTALLKELGLVKDDEPADPAKLAADLAATRTETAAAQRELAIFRNAPAGTNVQALLDSRSFLTKVADIDPTDTTALVAAIGEAVKSSPHFKATQAAAASGTDLTPGDTALPTFSRAQIRDVAFYRANRAAIQAASRRPGGITD